MHHWTPGDQHLRDVQSVKGGEIGLETACILLGDRRRGNKKSGEYGDLPKDPRYTDRKSLRRKARRRWGQQSAFHPMSSIQGTGILLPFGL